MPRAEVLAASSASAAFEARNSAVNVTVVVRAAGEGEHEEPRWGSAHRRSRSKGGGEGARPGKPVFVNVKSYLSYVKLQMVSHDVAAERTETWQCVAKRRSERGRSLGEAMRRQHRGRSLPKCSGVSADTGSSVQPQYQISAPLSIRAKSKGGDVHVHLPPTFSGMLSWVSESGTLRLSPGVQARYTPVGESKKHRGVGRIVPPEGADQPLRGDSAELISTRGDLRVSIAGEDKTADRGCTIA